MVYMSFGQEPTDERILPLRYLALNTVINNQLQIPFIKHLASIQTDFMPPLIGLSYEMGGKLKHHTYWKKILNRERCEKYKPSYHLQEKTFTLRCKECYNSLQNNCHMTLVFNPSSSLLINNIQNIHTKPPQFFANLYFETENQSFPVVINKFNKADFIEDGFIACWQKDKNTHRLQVYDFREYKTKGTLQPPFDLSFKDILIPPTPLLLSPDKNYLIGLFTFKLSTSNQDKEQRLIVAHGSSKTIIMNKLFHEQVKNIAVYNYFPGKKESLLDKFYLCIEIKFGTKQKEYQLIGA